MVTTNVVLLLLTPRILILLLFLSFRFLLRALATLTTSASLTTPTDMAILTNLNAHTFLTILTTVAAICDITNVLALTRLARLTTSMSLLAFALPSQRLPLLDPRPKLVLVLLLLRLLRLVAFLGGSVYDPQTLTIVATLSPFSFRCRCWSYNPFYPRCAHSHATLTSQATTRARLLRSLRSSCVL